MENYKILNLIGKGQFGSVFKAINKQNEQIVAIKFIPKTEQMKNKKKMEEIEVLHKIKHENVIEVIDFFQTKENKIGIVTEYIEKDLSLMIKEYQEESKEFSLKEIRKISRMLFNGIRYLHQYKRMIHRDIKPQNILIDSYLNNLKIIDFGFAKELDESSVLLESVKGSPLYMAPELILGKISEEKINKKHFNSNQNQIQRKFNFKVDIFSTGCVLYQLKYSNLPFKANSLIQLISTFLKNPEIHFPQKEINSPFVKLVQGLLEIDPQKRFGWKSIFSSPFLIQKKVENLRKQIQKFLSLNENSNEDCLLKKIDESLSQINKIKFISQKTAQYFLKFLERISTQNSDLKKQLILQILTSLSYVDSFLIFKSFFSNCFSNLIQFQDLELIIQNRTIEFGLNLLCDIDSISENDFIQSNFKNHVDLLVEMVDSFYIEKNQNQNQNNISFFKEKDLMQRIVFLVSKIIEKTQQFIKFTEFSKLENLIVISKKIFQKSKNIEMKKIIEVMDSFIFVSK